KTQLPTSENITLAVSTYFTFVSVSTPFITTKIITSYFTKLSSILFISTLNIEPTPPVNVPAADPANPPADPANPPAATAAPAATNVLPQSITIQDATAAPPTSISLQTTPSFTPPTPSPSTAPSPTFESTAGAGNTLIFILSVFTGLSFVSSAICTFILCRVHILNRTNTIKNRERENRYLED
ncbi:1570_t:CDS:1, partial [Cetraspora pellucida]